MSDKPKKAVILIQGVFDPRFFDLLKKKKTGEVFVLEGRPNLDAAKTSSRELLKRKIPPTLITDSMAGFLFFKEWVKEVWIAYQSDDRDGMLCDAGALILGVLAKKHKVPVYLFPSSRETDFLGKDKELTHFAGVRVAPQGIHGYVPLVEWLPKKYITKVIK